MKIIFLSLILSFCVSCQATPPVLKGEMHAALDGKIEVQGHRGARARYPENTLIAFTKALELCVDTLEMDIILSKENIPVVYHDPYVNKKRCLMANGARLDREYIIHDLALAELKKFDCGSLSQSKFPFQKQYPKERIPTLEEVFKLVENSKLACAKKIKFNVEIKIKRNKPKYYALPEIYVNKIMELVKKYKLEDRVIIQSFDFRTIKLVKEKYPQIKTAALTEDKGIDYLKVIEETGADILSPEWDTINIDNVKVMHAKGVRVIPWTANTKRIWDYLYKIGVDGIITDDPEALIVFLRSIGKR